MNLHPRVIAAAEATAGSTVGASWALICAGVPDSDRMKFYQVFGIDQLYLSPDLWHSVRASRQWRITALCFMATLIDTNDWKNL